MHMTARRLDDGQPLRQAIADFGGGRGITLQALRQLTVQADPGGKGVSYQLIAFLKSPASVGRGRFRTSTSTETAELIARSLGQPVTGLFEIVEVADRDDG